MIRLNLENPNTPDLAEGLFKERWKEDFHYIDYPRFLEMVKYYRGGSYLDVGCFNSPMPMILKEKFPDADVFALDHSEYVMKAMQKKVPKVKYLVGDCYKLPFGDEEIDYVVAGELIEHLEEPEKFIKEVMRVVKSGGGFFLSTPFEEGITQKAVSYEHLWGYTEQDIDNFLSPYGKATISLNKDNVWVIMGFCKKK